MIPLSWFLFVWLVLIAIFALMATLTVITNLRFGLSSSVSYFSTLIFLGGAACVLLLVGGYLLTVDWTAGVTLFGGGASSLLLP